MSQGNIGFRITGVVSWSNIAKQNLGRKHGGLRPKSVNESQRRATQNSSERTNIMCTLWKKWYSCAKHCAADRNSSCYHCIQLWRDPSSLPWIFPCHVWHKRDTTIRHCWWVKSIHDETILEMWNSVTLWVIPLPFWIPYCSWTT